MLSITDIEKLQATTEIDKDVWKDMVDFCVHDCAANEETFRGALAHMEEQYAEKWFGDEPKARTKSGKWKKTFTNDEGEKVYIIPNAWTTSKSIIVKALETGTPLMEDGVIRGQTAVANQARSVVKVEIDAYTRAMGYISKLSNVMSQGEFTDEQYDDINGRLKDLTV